jgi:hypothetical protein
MTDAIAVAAETRVFQRVHHLAVPGVALKTVLVPPLAV